MGVVQAVEQKKSNGSNGRETPSPQYKKKAAAKSFLPPSNSDSSVAPAAISESHRPVPAPLKSPPSYTKKNAPKEKVVVRMAKKKRAAKAPPPAKGKGKGAMILDRTPAAEGAENEINNPKPPKITGWYHTDWYPYYQGLASGDLVEPYLHGKECKPSDRRDLRRFVPSLFTLSLYTTQPDTFRQFLDKDYSWSFVFTGIGRYDVFPQLIEQMAHGFDVSQAQLTLSLMDSERSKWESWFHLKPSGVLDGVKGFGVYAARRFPRGVVIGFLCGRVLFRAAEKWTENPSDEYLAKYHPEVDVETCTIAIDPDGYKVVVHTKHDETGRLVNDHNLYMGLQYLRNIPFDDTSNENKMSCLMRPMGWLR